MEQNPTVLPKKVWNLVRVVYLMLKKGVSKKKLLLDINNMMIKRGKLAGKGLFHHHHHHNREIFSTNHLSFTSPEAAGEYEFSCNNSPSSNITTNKHHPFSLFSHHKKHEHHSLPSKDYLDMMAVNAVLKAMEMIHSENSSPALPGFGNTPVVRQLRVTDSPFLLNNSNNVDDNNHIDEAADQFISRFYNDLRQQN